MLPYLVQVENQVEVMEPAHSAHIQMNCFIMHNGHTCKSGA